MARFHHILACIICIAYYAIPVTGKDITDEDIYIPGEGYIQSIVTSDGSTLIGRITALTDNTIEFSTEYGILTVPRNGIEEIRTNPVSRRDGAYWMPDPNTTRLYFAPTGRMLPKGSGYIADYYLFFPTFNYGVTSNLSLGAGLSIFPSGSMAKQVYYFTPKFSIRQTDRLHLAAGALIIKLPDFDDEDTDGETNEFEEAPLVSVIYGTGTYGTSDMSITCGLGYGMVDTELADKPMLVLGGEKRLTRRLAFVTENWIFPGVENALISYGIRFLSEKFTTDFALLNTTGEDALFPGIPYIDFVYNF